MTLIDKDYLINVITLWQAGLKDELEKNLLEQVIHCVNAKDTIFDVQKLLCDINSNRLENDFVQQEDIKDAVIYNGAIDDVMEKVRNATNPFYRDCFDWEKKAY